ncbi:MAG: restriction endonuclease subunit S [Planctomycetota bacterium]|nr:restriction endonuclease subunit S [Planctomycetota bacterium]
MARSSAPAKPEPKAPPADADENGELPEGWAHANLGELIGSNGLFTDGDWVESKDQDPNGDVRLIQLADVGDGYYRNRSSRFLTKHKAAELVCTYLKHGDLLIARMPDPLGRACIYPGDTKEAVTVVDVCILRPDSSGPAAKFFMHFINSPQYRVFIEERSQGTTRKRISRGNLAGIPLPVPPIAEQKRIVAKVEALLARVNEARERLAKVPPILKRFRQSILAAACSGRLTEDWREGQLQLPDANEVLKAILENRKVKWESRKLARLIANGAAPKNDYWKREYEVPLPPESEEVFEEVPSWTTTGLEAILATDRPGMKTGPFGSALNKSEHQASGIPVLGIENIDSLQFIPGSKIHITKEKANELSPFDAKAGDILISRSGTVGEVCVVPANLGEARISTNILRVSLEPDTMLPQFFCFLFVGSPFVKNQVRRLCGGSTRDFLNQGILASLLLPFPSLTEQREIVRRVEKLFNLVDAIAKRVAAATARADKLTQAILARAFRGELVPTEAELARREGRSYEPASELLKRIQAARTEGKPTIGRKRGSKGA